MTPPVPGKQVFVIGPPPPSSVIVNDAAPPANPGELPTWIV